ALMTVQQTDCASAPFQRHFTNVKNLTRIHERNAGQSNKLCTISVRPTKALWCHYAACAKSVGVWAALAL
ncbi:hypothetical protein NDU88_003180, partial [Pleurodeles waltl]